MLLSDISDDSLSKGEGRGEEWPLVRILAAKIH